MSENAYTERRMTIMNAKNLNELASIDTKNAIRWTIKGLIGIIVPLVLNQFFDNDIIRAIVLILPFLSSFMLIWGLVILLAKLIKKYIDPQTSPKFRRNVKICSYIFSAMCFTVAVLVLIIQKGE